MYAEIEPTGASVRHGAVQLIIRLYLEPGDPRYNEHYVKVIDTNSAEFKAGYPGEIGVAKTNKEYFEWVEAYKKWEASLPRIWQNNPFNNHAIQVSPDTTDEEIKKLMEDALDEFGAVWSKGEDLMRYWKNKPNKPSYKPFNCDARIEQAIIKDLSEGKEVPGLDPVLAMQLKRCAIKGLDVAARAHSFKNVKKKDKR